MRGRRSLRPPPRSHPASTDTRGEILAVAERLFARSGFDATTVKQIGAEAEVNPALIYYYFGDKQGLYQAVIDSFGEELLDRAARALAEARTPEDVVRAIVATQSAMYVGHPERARIMARELVDNDAAHAGQFLQRLGREAFARLCEAIAEGQRAGTFDRRLDPAFAALSVVAQVVYFHLARPVVQAVMRDHGPIGAAEEAAFARHAANFALAALSSRPVPRKSRSERTRKGT